jgi:iron complex transport system ATP-binding protein
LDEPTASLDLAHQIRIMDLMRKLKDDKRISVIMVSHDVNLAAMYADEMILLSKGSIVEQGSPEKVLTFETLEKAYDCKLLVDESPIGKFPRITLIPQRFLKNSNT